MRFWGSLLQFFFGSFFFHVLACESNLLEPIPKVEIAGDLQTCKCYEFIKTFASLGVILDVALNSQRFFFLASEGVPW